MRLINVWTGLLEEFHELERPEYAILSHTWGKNEITFKQIQLPDVEKWPSYHKIGFCAEQAAKDGYRYVWIDTCCIDTSSSTELSEAINSMFRWYRDAAVCYAHLEDVESLEPTASKAFENSRYFGRGWTLQELLAPKKMHFYGANFTPLADRNVLAERIFNITKIPTDIIRGYQSYTSCSVAQRMSWASERQTTRTEDIAYCLLGLFQVNMPLLYGEGEKAFSRLQEEIVKHSDDQSLFAWKSSHDRWDLGADLIRETSMFARTPRDFRSSANIVPLNPVVDVDPYIVTHKGLRIQLPLIKQDHFIVALLACRDLKAPGKRIGIRLQQASGGKTYYKLRFTDDRGLLRISADAGKIPLKTIYIVPDTKFVRVTEKQVMRPTTYLLTDTLGKDVGYRISQAFPESAWTREHGRNWTGSHIPCSSSAAVMYTHSSSPSLIVYFAPKDYFETGHLDRVCVFQVPNISDLSLAYFVERISNCIYHAEEWDLPGSGSVDVDMVKDGWDEDLCHVVIKRLDGRFICKRKYNI